MFIESIDYKLFKVSILLRNNVEYPIKNIKKYFGDLREPKSLEQIPNQDIVLHFAGKTHSRSYSNYYEGNVCCTKNLLNHFKHHGAKKFIFISTRCAQSNGGSYGVTKLLAEKLIIESKINFIILRVSEVFGENQSSFKFLKLLSKFSPIIFLPYWKNIHLNPILISDLVKLIKLILASDKQINQTYLVAGNENFNLKKLISMLPGFLRDYRIFIPIPIFILRILAYGNLILKKPYFYPDQLDRLICKKKTNIDKIKKDFNFIPQSIRDFLEKPYN